MQMYGMGVGSGRIPFPSFGGAPSGGSPFFGSAGGGGVM
jgi:hypothetical protein